MNQKEILEKKIAAMLNEASASGLPDDAMGDVSIAFQQYLAFVDPEETTVSSDDDAESGDESMDEDNVTDHNPDAGHQIEDGE